MRYPIVYLYSTTRGFFVFYWAKFHVSADDIRSVNGLHEPDIVPGQALLINTNRYTIQPGDSFYTISQKSFIPVDMLLRANPGLNPYFLQPGMQILLPDLPQYTASAFNYFYVTGTTSDQHIIRNFSPYSTYYSFFEYHFFNGGTLSPLNDLRAVEEAWNNSAAPLATITNLTSDGFSSELASSTLNHSVTRQHLIRNIFNLVTERGYAGVNIDFEGILPQDRDIFSTFLRELRDLLHSRSLLLTIAAHPKTSENIPWLEGYDYGAIGSVVDFVFVMAYDWHHMASEPGPVAPIHEVRKTIEFALQHIDRNKLIIGVPLYGYDWTLPYRPGSSVSAISNQYATELATRHGSTIYYSPEHESPYFYYVDEQRESHVIWFEDSRSISKKLSLIREYRLHGVGAWQIGLNFPQGPWLLTKFFNIRRVT